jgi:hypothetical protein
MDKICKVPNPHNSRYKDKLIPFSSNVKLSQINAKLTRLHPMIEGGHKNLNNFESYHKILTEIIKAKKSKIDLSTTSIGIKHTSR